MNILADKLQTTTLGEFIDALIITNIRMWHDQEKAYEPENLAQLTKDEMLDLLKRATWLNLSRNFTMDGIDTTLTEKIVLRYPKLDRKDKPLPMEGQSPIWEQA